jgi:hypothetical protein
METLEMIGILCIAIAVILVLVLLVSKKTLKGTPLANPMMALIVAVILGVVGWFPLGGGDAINELITPEATAYVPYTPTTPTSTYVSATFDITPTAQGNSGFTLDSTHTIFSLPIIAYYDTNVIAESDNTTWVDADMVFTVRPIPWSGADNDDLATIFYEFSDPELTVDTTGTYYVFTKTGGERQITWFAYGSTLEYVSGSHTMLLTDSATIFCNTSLIQDSVSRIENLYDPLTCYVTFYNAARTWSKTYSLNMFLIDQINV